MLKLKGLFLLNRGFLRKYSNDIREFIRIIDILVCVNTFYFYNYNFLENQASNLGNISLCIVTIICISTLSFSKIYKNQRQYNFFDKSILLISRWMAFLVTLCGFTFITRTSYYFSRIYVISWAIVFLIYLSIIHLLGRELLKIYRNKGGNSRVVLYIGDRLNFEKINNFLNENKYLGIEIKHKFLFWNDNDSQKYDLLEKNNYISKLLNEIKVWLQNNDIDMIWFDDKNIDKEYIDIFFKFFGDRCLPIYYFPSWYKTSMTFNALSLGPFRFIEIWRREDSKLKLFQKRIFDLTISFLLIIILLPIFILISILIHIDSDGPIIFIQNRYGLDGKFFKIFKFRTMSFQKESSGYTKQAIQNDPRVTKIGKYLRAASLDELPQLFNVFMGKMSLVGPRPHAVDHNEFYRKKIHGYMQRHSCKPGMTGLAQIRGFRGNTDKDELMQKRIDSDLEYLSNWTIKEDFLILFKTFFLVIKNRAF